MLFLNRTAELAALEGLGEGLAVLWGRRRIGKTRLLLRWCERAGGINTVADQAGPEIQRASSAPDSFGLREYVPGLICPDGEQN